MGYYQLDKLVRPKGNAQIQRASDLPKNSNKNKKRSKIKNRRTKKIDLNAAVIF